MKFYYEVLRLKSKEKPFLPFSAKTLPSLSIMPILTPQRTNEPSTAKYSFVNLRSIKMVCKTLKKKS